MNERLIDLYVQRGRLRERIGAQRGELARELEPLGTALHAVDRSRVLAQRAQVWLLAHPVVVTAVVVALAVWRPRAVARAARWGFSAWRNWAQLREWLNAGFKPL